MGGVTPLEQTDGMQSAHTAAAASARRETASRRETAGSLLDRADGTASELVIGPSEFAEYEQELDRLRAVRASDLPDRFRRAREHVAADAAEEIAHIQGDSTVIDARIARLEHLLRAAIVLPDGPDGVATLGSVVEVSYERTGRRASYRLTGVPASDAPSVSARSPVGRALMGRRVGDVVSVQLPSGRVESLRIAAITAPAGVQAA